MNEICFRFSVLQIDESDQLGIYHGSNDQSIMKQFSGNLGMFSVSVLANSLFVKFKSDQYITKDGFLATIHYGNPYLIIK